MDYRIVYKNNDGSCGIILPTDEFMDLVKDVIRTSHPELSVDEVLAAALDIVAQKDVPSGLSYRIITKDKLPSDRLYRDAWTDDNPTDTVDVDMVKARKIKLEEIREKRNAKLIDLDYDYIKADEAASQAQKSQIIAKKNALRNLPATVNLANINTPEELKAFIPNELK